jgi:hypothetical protein
VRRVGNFRKSLASEPVDGLTAGFCISLYVDLLIRFQDSLGSFRQDWLIFRTKVRHARVAPDGYGTCMCVDGLGIGQTFPGSQDAQILKLPGLWEDATLK